MRKPNLVVQAPEHRILAATEAEFPGAVDPRLDTDKHLGGSDGYAASGPQCPWRASRSGDPSVGLVSQKHSLNALKRRL